jgi:putative FmdB family regulatory protein
MPIYEYRCQDCTHEFEHLVFGTDAIEPVCPRCARRNVKRLVSAVSFLSTAGIGTCAAGPVRGPG